MAELKPLKKPTGGKKTKVKVGTTRKKPIRAMGAKAKSGTIGLYSWDPGSYMNRLDTAGDPPETRGHYGRNVGNISYKYKGAQITPRPKKKKTKKTATKKTSGGRKSASGVK